jgi:PAS domain-containing protein
MSSYQSPDPDRSVVDEDLGDLFEEAPVAYVHEDMDTRFIRANRAAREILGISAEEVAFPWWSTPRKRNKTWAMPSNDSASAVAPNIGS